MKEEIDHAHAPAAALGQVLTLRVSSTILPLEMGLYAFCAARIRGAC